MRRIVIVCSLLVAGLLCCGSALACSFEECTQTWKLVRHRFHDCQSDTAMLAPANDTRLNLMLFLADMHADRYKAALAAAAPPKNQDSPLIDWVVFNARFGMKKGGAASKSDDSKDNGDHGSQTPGRADGFSGAVQADLALTPQERDALLAARVAVRSKERMKASDKAALSEALAKAVQAATTASGKIFADYLAGAKLFREGDYKEAADAFTQLAGAENPWIKETALYMQGRIALKRAQEGSFDDDGDLKSDWKADPALIEAGEAALDAYLAAYPKGLYAASAAGLKRRGYWIGAVTDKLAREYEALIAMDPAGRNMSDPDLVQEIDNKLFPVRHWQPLSASPVLLAVSDLLRMRTPEGMSGADVPGKPTTRASLTRTDLEAQKEAFAGNIPLYEYLLAAYAFYVENQPAEVLGLIPDAARQKSFTYLEFSRQMLRGLALEAVNDRNALGFWMQMLPGSDMPFQRSALELAIALHHERVGTIDKIFDADSPVQYPYLRQILLLHVADAALLRKQATNPNASQRERDKALFTLLHKEATYGRATDFLRDVALVPSDARERGSYVSADGAFHEYDDKADESPVPLGRFRGPMGGEYNCPSMAEVQKSLVKDPKDPAALLCLVNNAYGLDTASSKADELGGSPSQFVGKPLAPPVKIYESVLANPRASADNKAYALYSAIKCYQYGLNGCGGEDVPVAQRKAWFQHLKKDYPATRWAKELKYYW